MDSKSDNAASIIIGQFRRYKRTNINRSGCCHRGVLSPSVNAPPCDQATQARHDNMILYLQSYYDVMITPSPFFANNNYILIAMLYLYFSSKQQSQLPTRCNNPVRRPQAVFSQMYTTACPQVAGMLVTRSRSQLPSETYGLATVMARAPAGMRSSFACRVSRSVALRQQACTKTSVADSQPPSTASASRCWSSICILFLLSLNVGLISLSYFINNIRAAPDNDSSIS
mmetsp:Transcript_43400/g.67813  ORF Transcript_43400/g.67813 Transcript_43400/m.67813 type:complete len:228 (-) Transcript_43400:707-1390(-)